MIEPLKPRTVYFRPAPKPKPDPKPRTSFERYLLERLEKLEARTEGNETDIGDIFNHLGW